MRFGAGDRHDRERRLCAGLSGKARSPGQPYAAGGPADLLARTLAAGMGDLLGQQVVILNKPGGATAIGAASSPPRRPTATPC